MIGLKDSYMNNVILITLDVIIFHHRT